MATISFVTPEELAALKQEVIELRELIRAYVTTQEEWLDTATAMRTTGIKARSTLAMYKRASRPGVVEPGRITYKKEGTKCLYLRSSCIDYRQRKHGQPTLGN
jgi:hypothetical protein